MSFKFRRDYLIENDEIFCSDDSEKADADGRPVCSRTPTPTTCSRRVAARTLNDYNLIKDLAVMTVMEEKVSLHSARFYLHEQILGSPNFTPKKCVN